MDHKVTRVWPEDFVAYNNKFNQKEKVQEEKPQKVEQRRNGRSRSKRGSEN